MHCSLGGLPTIDKPRWAMYVSMCWSISNFCFNTESDPIEMGRILMISPLTMEFFVQVSFRATPPLRLIYTFSLDCIVD